MPRKKGGGKRKLAKKQSGGRDLKPENYRIQMGSTKTTGRTLIKIGREERTRILEQKGTIKDQNRDHDQDQMEGSKEKEKGREKKTRATTPLSWARSTKK